MYISRHEHTMAAFVALPPLLAQPKYFGLVSGDRQASVSIGVHLG